MGMIRSGWICSACSALQVALAARAVPLTSTTSDDGSTQQPRMASVHEASPDQAEGGSNSWSGVTRSAGRRRCPFGHTPQGFRQRLLKMSVEDQRRDARDMMVALNDLCGQARNAGVDIRPLLLDVAELSSDVDEYGMGSTRAFCSGRPVRSPSGSGERATRDPVRRPSKAHREPRPTTSASSALPSNGLIRNERPIKIIVSFQSASLMGEVSTKSHMIGWNSPLCDRS